MEVGVRQLRDELRRWIDAVQNGEEVTITERGKPVARLVAASGSSRIQRLIEEGTLTPPERPKRPSHEYPRVRAKGPVSDLIAEQRR